MLSIPCAFDSPVTFQNTFLHSLGCKISLECLARTDKEDLGMTRD